MVALASAFIRVRPQVDQREFKKAGEDAGAAAGKAAGGSYGTGFKRDADGKLRDANGKFVKDSTGVGAQAGTNAGKGFGEGFSKGSSGIAGTIKKNLGLAAGVFVPLGLGAAVGEIAKIGIAYEDNLNIFKSVSSATAAEMAKVADKARQLGADVQLPGVSAGGAAAAMTELAKAGFTVEESMDAARGTLQLARIASISEADAAEIAANAVNAFGIEAKDTAFVVDELAAAANSSSIEISDASLAFKQASAVFSGIQGPVVGGKEAITELNTAIAILGNNGIKGSDAGTSLKQSLLQLTGPSDKAKDAMKLLALNAGQARIGQAQFNTVLNAGKKDRSAALADINKLNPGLKLQGDIAYDAAGRMRPLRDILGLVAAGTQGLTQEQKNLAITTIFGSDAARSIFALLKGGVPVYDEQRKAILKSGAAADFAAAKNAGLGGAIDNVKSQFENAAISIYNAAKGPLTASLNSLAEILPKIFGYIGDFSKFVSDNIGVIRDWAVAIGAVTLALKINSAMLAVTAAGGILQWFKGVSVVVKITQAWAAAQAVLNATLIANPIGAIIVAIVALVAGLVLLYKHNETFRKIVLAVWGAIKTAISATVDWIVHTAWPAIVSAWNAIAAAAVWLWKNVIQPVWNGIKAVIDFVVAAVTLYIRALVAEFKFIAGIAMWLWHNIFEPVFNGIKKAVEIWWLAVQIVFKLLANIITSVVGRAVNWLRDLWNSVFNWISDKVKTWWAGMKIIFEAFRVYVVGPLVGGLNVFLGWVRKIFGWIATYVSAWYKTYIKPIFDAVRNLWNNVALGLSLIWNQKIKPMFQQFIDFIKKYVVGGFKTAVDAISTAWDKVREAARKPVAFVVNKIINPFIGGLNRAAALVGVKDRVEPIKGFATGGQIPGYATGGKISGAPSVTDNRLAPARIPGVGAVKLAGGEYIVNARDTRKALPLLKWVNSGMKGGPALLARMLGKPVANEPGDGSEGWAFADGGLVGWTKDIWGAITDPSTIKKPFEALLKQIPGGGMIKDFLIGSAKRLLNGAVSWLVGGSGTAAGGSAMSTARAVRARTFVQSQAGKPYIWADAGPDGYDCSGIVSAAYNILKGNNPYSHTFSTGSLPGPWFDPGRKIGTLVAGWSHPGQRPASASVGHMAGQIAGMPFESTGSGGVRIGDRARRVGEFANVGAARSMGGLIGALAGSPIRLFDNGGAWPSGTLGANLSGRTEYVDPNRRGAGTRNYTINVNIAPGGHPAEAGRVIVKAVQAFEANEGKGWRNG